MAVEFFCGFHVCHMEAMEFFGKHADKRVGAEEADRFFFYPIFICIGLMDVWIERDSMVKIMGVRSGFRGALTALLSGMVTAVPLYALLPVAGVLLKKGSRVSNVILFLCASSSIRIPLLLFEISSFGWRFTFVRFGLNILVVAAIAFITEKLLTDADKNEIFRKNEEL